MLVSEEDWLARKTLMLLSASVEKMRLFTPTIPTIEVPDTFSRQQLPMLVMPVIIRPLPRQSRRMTDPCSCGRKVFFTRRGMSFT